MKLEDKFKIKYPQPYSIKIRTGNPALDYCLIMKEHRRMKYQAKWLKSKNNKRLY